MNVRSSAARRLALAGLTLGCMLAAAPAAQADTTVSLEAGAFGAGLSGDHVYVRDTVSLFDEPMQVTVTRSGGFVRVTDQAGEVHVNGPGCTVVGAQARCSDAGLDGLLIEGSDRNDVLVNGSSTTAVLRGDRGDDELFGGLGRDQLSGEAGDDDLYGGDGPDAFGLEPGSDRIDGQAGTDTVSYAASQAGVNVSLGDGLVNDGPFAEPDRLLNVENAIGSPFADLVRGSEQRNVISGRGGNDTLRGEGGDDLLDGGEGRDVMSGEAGVDTVTYDDRTSGVIVDLDFDFDDGNALDGPVGSRDMVTTTIENVTGGSGDDKLTGQHDGATVRNLLRGGAGNDVLDGDLADDTLDGGDGDDELIGDAGNDTLDGGAGDDDLDGGAGADLLRGAAGRDIADGGTDGDVIDGGDSPETNGDTLVYATRPDDLVLRLDTAGLRDDGGPADGPPGQRDAVSNFERVIGGFGNDRIVGSARDEFLDGSRGDDELQGNAGDDRIAGGIGFDALFGGPGADALVTNDGLVDGSISCGEDPGPDPEDTLTADLDDVIAHPEVHVPGDPTECEVIVIP